MRFVPLALLLASLGACRVSADDLGRVSSVPDLEAPAPTPPPAESAPAEKLYQLLYAGELGAEAHPAWPSGRPTSWIA